MFEAATTAMSQVLLSGARINEFEFRTITGEHSDHPPAGQGLFLFLKTKNLLRAFIPGTPLGPSGVYMVS